MPVTGSFNNKATRRIGALATLIIALDQFSKWLVLRAIPVGDENNVIPGFFSLVHRNNSGAAWSLFTGNNFALAGIALVALVVLFLARHHFKAETFFGQIAFGLIFGGIIGNLIDRLLPTRHAVVDFLYFFMQRRGGGTIDFPAFNVADSAICTGVALIFIISWKSEHAPKPIGT